MNVLRLKETMLMNKVEFLEKKTRILMFEFNIISLNNKISVGFMPHENCTLLKGY